MTPFPCSWISSFLILETKIRLNFSLLKAHSEFWFPSLEGGAGRDWYTIQPNKLYNGEMDKKFINPQHFNYPEYTKCPFKLKPTECI